METCALLSPRKNSSSREASILLDGLQAAFGKNQELREEIERLKASIEKYELEMNRIKRLSLGED